MTQKEKILAGVGAVAALAVLYLLTRSGGGSSSVTNSPVLNIGGGGGSSFNVGSPAGDGSGIIIPGLTNPPIDTGSGAAQGGSGSGSGGSGGCGCPTSTSFGNPAGFALALAQAAAAPFQQPINGGNASVVNAAINDAPPSSSGRMVALVPNPARRAWDALVRSVGSTLGAGTPPAAYVPVGSIPYA